MSIRSVSLSLLLAGASLGALSGCSRSEADPRTEPPLVRTATLGAPEAAERGYTGIVSARVQSDLGFRVPGKVV